MVFGNIFVFYILVFVFIMRFYFCGGLDCPDWILAEIALISKLTSVKVKLLSTRVCTSILEDKFDLEGIQKLTADAKFEDHDTKSTVAAVRFILTSGARFNVDQETLSSELQQLGLPKEHSTAICRVYNDKKSNLMEKLQEISLRLSKLGDVDCKIDYEKCISTREKIPMVTLNMEKVIPTNNQVEKKSFTLTKDKLNVLIFELKQAENMINKFS